MTSKILVADDSITIQKIVAMAFEHEDTVVEGASNGKDAFNRLAEFRPDIVLADVDMPGINGFELSRKIKDSEEFGRIPVLLLASDFDEFNNDLFRDSRADDRISKPFKSDEIIEKVKARLKSGASQANGQEASILQAETEGLDDPDEMLFVLSEEHLIEEPGQGLLDADEPEKAIADSGGDVDFDLAAHLVDEDEASPGDGLAQAEAYAALEEEETGFDLSSYLVDEDETSRGDVLTPVETEAGVNGVSGPEVPDPASTLEEDWLGALGEGDAVSSGAGENGFTPLFDEESFLAGENGRGPALLHEDSRVEEPRTPPAVEPPAAPVPGKTRPGKSLEDLLSLVDRLSHPGKPEAAPAAEKKPAPVKSMPETAAVIDRVIHKVDRLKETALSREDGPLQAGSAEIQVKPGAAVKAPAPNGGGPTDTAPAVVEDAVKAAGGGAPKASFFAEKTRTRPEAEPEAPSQPEAQPARKRELKEIARSLEEGPLAPLDEERIKRVLESSLDQAIRKELAGFSEAVLKTIREVVREVAGEAIKAAVREEMEKISKWRSE